MKYINTYETYGPFMKKKPIQFEDEYLKIHKVTEGENKGKILFRFYNNETNTYIDKYSMALGCAMILDTKYETLPEIRSIEIGGIKFRKVFSSTINSIIDRFLEDIGYQEHDIRNRRFNDLKTINLVKITEEINKIVNVANDIGDVLDGLKNIREIDFDEWKLYRATKQYNL